jgi:hypothetical protein
MVGRFEVRFTTLIIGERFKRGIYRPCIETIPSSTIAGFFRENFGIHGATGVGGIDSDSYERKWAVAGLFDEALHGVKFPIETEYLAQRNGGIRATLYLRWQESLEYLKEVKQLPVAMGAWRHKGFGRGLLSFVEVFEPTIRLIELKTRLTRPAAQALGVHRVLAPVFGYLFETTGPVTGRWVPSLFEGSIVEGPDFLGETHRYDT